MRRMKLKFAPKVGVAKTKGSNSSAVSHVTSSNTLASSITEVGALDTNVSSSEMTNETISGSDSPETNPVNDTFDICKTDLVELPKSSSLLETTALSSTLFDTNASTALLEIHAPSTLLESGGASSTWLKTDASAILLNTDSNSNKTAVSCPSSVQHPSSSAAVSSVRSSAEVSTASSSAAAPTFSAPAKVHKSSSPATVHKCSPPATVPTASSPAAVATVTSSAAVSTVTSSAAVSAVTSSATVSAVTSSATVSAVTSSAAVHTVSSPATIPTAASSAAVATVVSSAATAIVTSSAALTSVVLPTAAAPGVPYRRSRLNIKPKTKLNIRIPASTKMPADCKKNNSSASDTPTNKSKDTSDLGPKGLVETLGILGNVVNPLTEINPQQEIQSLSLQRSLCSTYETKENSNEGLAVDGVPIPALTPPKTTENSPERRRPACDSISLQGKVQDSNSSDTSVVQEMNAYSCLTPPKENQVKEGSSTVTGANSDEKESAELVTSHMELFTSGQNAASTYKNVPDDALSSALLDTNPLPRVNSSKLEKPMSFRKKMKIVPNLGLRRNKIPPKVGYNPENMISSSESTVSPEHDNVGSVIVVQKCNKLENTTVKNIKDKVIMEHSNFPLPSKSLGVNENSSSSSIEHRIKNGQDHETSIAVAAAANGKSENYLHIQSESSASVTSNRSGIKKVGKLTKENLTSVSCNKENVNSNCLLLDRDDGMSVCSMETTEETRLYRERKQKFREKLTEGALERNLTMFDLIYFNPDASPMPGREKVNPAPRGRKRLLSNTASSLAADEQREEDEAVDDPVAEETAVDKEIEAPIASQEPDEVSGLSDENGEAENTGEENDEFDLLAPQIKLGPNNEVIIDQKSLLIKTSNEEERLNSLSNEVVEESENTRKSYTKKRKRASDWGPKETAYFYTALSTVGTDFQLLHDVFFKKWRSREQVKTKYKKEERINKALVDKAVSELTQYDLTVFQTEPEFDPAAERASAREAEKALQRERKRAQQLLLQQERLKERDYRRSQKMTDKTRKKVLRDNFRPKRSRKQQKKSSLDEKDDSMDEMEELNLEESNVSGEDDSPALQSANSTSVNATIDFVINNKTLRYSSPLVKSNKKKRQYRKSAVTTAGPGAGAATSSTPSAEEEEEKEAGDKDALRRSTRVKKPRKLVSFVESFNDSASDIEGDDDDGDYVVGEELQEGGGRKKGKNMDNFDWGEEGREDSSRRVGSAGEESSDGGDGDGVDDPLEYDTNSFANTSSASLGDGAMSAVLADPSAYLSSISLLDTTLEGVTMNDSADQQHPRVGSESDCYQVPSSSSSRAEESNSTTASRPNGDAFAVRSPRNTTASCSKATEKSPVRSKRKRGRPITKTRQRKNVIYSESSGAEEEEEESEDEGLQDTDRLKVMVDTGSTIKLQLQGIRLDQLTCAHPVKLGKLNVAAREGDGTSAAQKREDSGTSKILQGNAISGNHNDDALLAFGVDGITDQGPTRSSNQQRLDDAGRAEDSMVLSERQETNSPESNVTILKVHDEKTCSTMVTTSKGTSECFAIDIGTAPFETRAVSIQDEMIVRKEEDFPHKNKKNNESERRSANELIEDVVYTEVIDSFVSDTAAGGLSESDEEQAPFQQQPIVFTDHKPVAPNTSNPICVKVETDNVVGSFVGNNSQTAVVTRRPKLKLAPKLKPALARARLAAARGLSIPQDHAMTTSHSSGSRTNVPGPIEMSAEVSGDDLAVVPVRELVQSLKPSTTATVDMACVRDGTNNLSPQEQSVEEAVTVAEEPMPNALVHYPEQRSTRMVSSLVSSQLATASRIGEFSECQSLLSVQQRSLCPSASHEGPTQKRLRVSSESTTLNPDDATSLKKNHSDGSRMACEGVFSPRKSPSINSRRRSFNPESLGSLIHTGSIAEPLMRRNSASVSFQAECYGKDQDVSQATWHSENKFGSNRSYPSSNINSARQDQLIGLETSGTTTNSFREPDAKMESVGGSNQELESGSCLEILTSHAFIDNRGTSPSTVKQRCSKPILSQPTVETGAQYSVFRDVYVASSSVRADQEKASQRSAPTTIDAEECDASDCTIIDTRSLSGHSVPYKVEVTEESSMDNLDTAKLNKFFNSGRGNLARNATSSLSSRRSSCSSSAGRVISSSTNTASSHPFSRQYYSHERTPCRSPLQPLQVQTRLPSLSAEKSSQQSPSVAERLHSPRATSLTSPHYRTAFPASPLHVESQRDDRFEQAGPSILQITTLPGSESYEQRLFTDPVKKEFLVPNPSTVLLNEHGGVSRSSSFRRHESFSNQQQLHHSLTGHKIDESYSRPMSRVELIEISSDGGRSSSVVSSRPQSRMSVSSLDDPFPVRPLSCIKAEMEDILVRSLHCDERPSRPASVVIQSPINFVNVYENDLRMCQIVRVQSESLPPPSIRQSPLGLSNERYSPHIALPTRHSPFVSHASLSSCHSPHGTLSIEGRRSRLSMAAPLPLSRVASPHCAGGAFSHPSPSPSVEVIHSSIPLPRFASDSDSSSVAVRSTSYFSAGSSASGQPTTATMQPTPTIFVQPLRLSASSTRPSPAPSPSLCRRSPYVPPSPHGAHSGQLYMTSPLQRSVSSSPQPHSTRSPASPRWPDQQQHLQQHLQPPQRAPQPQKLRFSPNDIVLEKGRPVLMVPRHGIDPDNFVPLPVNSLPNDAVGLIVEVTPVPGTKNYSYNLYVETRETPNEGAL